MRRPDRQSPTDERAGRLLEDRPASEDDTVPAGDIHRVYQALLLLRAGLPPQEIASRLPKLAHGASEAGVSPKSLEMILRSGTRSLLTGVLLDRPPPGLPEALWPPEEVRNAVRETRGGRTWRLQLRVLREWLEASSSPGEA